MLLLLTNPTITTPLSAKIPFELQGAKKDSLLCSCFYEYVPRQRRRPESCNLLNISLCSRSPSPAVSTLDGVQR